MLSLYHIRRISYSFQPYHGPGADSAASENEYQEHFLGERRPVHEADNLIAFMCRLLWNLGSLNLLETSEPHRACYGIAFLNVLVNGNTYW